jgi:hypothetical protein
LNFGSEWLIGQSDIGLLVEISNSTAFNGGFYSKFMKNQFTGEKVEIPGNRGLYWRMQLVLVHRVRREGLQFSW